MKKMTLTRVVFLGVCGFCLAGLVLSEPASAAEKKLKKKNTENVIAYRLSEHLAEAEAFIVLPKGDDVAGKWTGSDFTFPNSPRQFNVVLVSRPYEKQMQKAIGMDTLPAATRVLRFPKVPAASTMVLHYGIPDSAFLREIKANLYLSIQIGTNPLDRILIPVEKGWRTATFNLGVAAFLLRDLPITFELSVDERTSIPFSFDAEFLR